MISKINKQIIIVRAEDIQFSSMGLKSAKMIQEVLSKYYKHVGIASVGNLDDLEQIVNQKPDLVFLGLKRIEHNGELIWLSEYLDEHGINYSGSKKSAMELDLNKASAKQLMQQNGIATAAFFKATPRQFSGSQELPVKFPLFIKPHDQGGGMGIGPDSIAHDFSSYEQKVQQLFDRYSSFSLVEEYLQGREFSVAILGSGHRDELLAMPIELITKPNELGDRILGQAVKSEDNERAVEVKDTLLHAQLAQLGAEIFTVLGGRDYGRIDIRMDGRGTACFMEANLTPGIAHNDFVSYFMRACELNQRMDYETTILRITGLGLARSLDNLESEFDFVSSTNTIWVASEPVPSAA